jgi:hypothetical protein
VASEGDSTAFLIQWDRLCWQLFSGASGCRYARTATHYIEEERDDRSLS